MLVLAELIVAEVVICLVASYLVAEQFLNPILYLTISSE